MLRPAALALACCLWLASARCSRDVSHSGLVPYTRAHAAFLDATAGELGGFPRVTGNVPARPSGQHLAISKTLLEAIAGIEREYGQRPSPATRGAAAVVALWQGAADEAVELLSRATTEAPADPRLWNDLSAARLVSAAETGEVLSVADALEAAARAAELEPEASEPACNRALALDRLGVPEESRTSWRRCRERSTSDGVRRGAAVAFSRFEEPAVPERWRRQRSQMPRGAVDPEAVRTLVGIDPQRSREWVLVELLPEWADLWLAGEQSAAHRVLARARAVGEALVARGGDATALHAVRAIEKAAGNGGALAGLARGHRAYGRGFSLLRPSYRASAAQEPLVEAATLLRRGGSPVALWAEKWLAVENLVDDRFSALADRFGRLLGEADAGPYPALAGRLHWGLGMAQARQGEWMEGLYHFRQARSAFTSAGEQENLGAAESLIGEAENALGREQAAWAARGRAADALRHFPSSRFLHNLLWLSGEALAESGRPHAALHFHVEGVRVAKRTGDPQVEAEAILRRSRAWLALDRPRDSLRDLEAARQSARAIKHPPLRERVEARVAAIAGEVERRLNPRSALAGLDRSVAFYRGRRLEIELAQVYLARARVRRDLGRSAAADRDLAAASESLERQRRRIGPGRLGRSFLETAQEVFDERIHLQVEDLDQPVRALTTVEQARVGLDEEAWRGHGEGLVAGWPEEVELLEYALVEDRLFRWRLWRGRLELETRTVAPDELEVCIGRFLHTLTTSSDRGAPEEATALARLLLPPDLESETVVVVPDKILGRVPFAALVNPATGRFLVEERSVVLAPSASVYITARRKSAVLGATLPRRPLVVGRPAFDRQRFPGLADLPGARAEATAVAGLYPEADDLVDDDATAPAFLARLPRAEILHFAGHAVGATSSPGDARLVLAPGHGGGSGLVGPADLAGSDVSRLRLAVLSACSTGAAPSRRTELLAGVAAAFLDAGVPAVLGTLWPVADAPAQELLVVFHRAYRTSGDPALALAQAQRSLIQHSDPRFRSPAAWAAFVVVGADTPRRTEP